MYVVIELIVGKFKLEYMKTLKEERADIQFEYFFARIDKKNAQSMHYSNIKRYFGRTFPKTPSFRNRTKQRVTL